MPPKDLAGVEVRDEQGSNSPNQDSAEFRRGRSGATTL